METMEIIALKNINPFDKLTLDYNDTEKELYQGFYCSCGADNCRGYIEGYKKEKEV